MTGLRHLLKGATIAVALAATAIVTTGPAAARDGYYSHDSNRDGYNDNGRYDDSRYGHRRHHRHYRGYNNGYGNDGGDVALSLLFGNIAFGYRDGYWDNGHRWHNWRNDGEYRNYRGHRGGNFHDWNHDRDRDNGWRNR